MGMRKVWTIAAAAAVCAALVLTRQKPVQYRCAAVEVREIAVCVEAVGTVNFAQTRALNVPTAGTVARVFLQEGDAVQEGQAVAELSVPCAHLRTAFFILCRSTPARRSRPAWRRARWFRRRSASRRWCRKARWSSSKSGKLLR